MKKNEFEIGEFYKCEGYVIKILDKTNIQVIMSLNEPDSIEVGTIVPAIPALNLISWTKL